MQRRCCRCCEPTMGASSAINSSEKTMIAYIGSCISNSTCANAFVTAGSERSGPTSTSPPPILVFENGVCGGEQSTNAKGQKFPNPATLDQRRQGRRWSKPKTLRHLIRRLPARRRRGRFYPRTKKSMATNKPADRQQNLATTQKTP